MLKVEIKKNVALIGGGVRYKGIVPKFIFKLQDKDSKIVVDENIAELYGNNYSSYLVQI